MKILLVNKFHYMKGGSERYYFGLGEQLKKKGYEVIYFSMKDKKNHPCAEENYFVDNVDYNTHMDLPELVKTSLKLLYSMEAKRKFEKLIKAEKPDIIHLNIFQSQLSASIVDAAYKYRIPIVYTAHDLKSICPNYLMLSHGVVCEECKGGKYWHCVRNGCMKDSKLKSILAAMESYVYRCRGTYRKIDLIIAPSLFYKNKIGEAGITDSRVIYLPNFLSDEAEYKAEIIKGEYFLYFGRISKEKGILTLIKAYAEASVENPLYIVGTGPIENDAQCLIQDLHKEEKIRLLGFKTGQELRDAIKNSLCVCIFSEWYENAPYSVMESMAMGKPVIASSMGGLPELVRDNVNGYVAEAHNTAKIKDILVKMAHISEEDYLTISKNAKNMAKEKFNADSYIDRLALEYKGLLKTGMRR